VDTNIIVVDFDDTICIHPTTDKSSIPAGKPNRLLIDQLNRAYNKGYKIHILTARGHLSTASREAAEKKYRHLIEEYLKKYNVKYDIISFEKPYAMFYIDDKALRPGEGFVLDYLETAN